MKEPTNLKILDEDGLECDDEKPYAFTPLDDEKQSWFSEVVQIIDSVLIYLCFFAGAVTIGRFLASLLSYVSGDTDVDINPWN